jgi:flagellar biosynthetic protein FliR
MNVMTRIMLALAFAFMIFTGGDAVPAVYSGDVPSYVTLVITEFVVGATIAFAAYVVFTAIHFAGQLIDYQIGFSMVSVFDPASQVQVPITGNLLYFMASALFVQFGGLHNLFAALAQSYNGIPINGAFFWNNSRLFMFMVNLITDFFILGMRIAMPLVGAMVITDVALGILVKAVPQMNVFAVGMPLKLVVGLIILFLIMPVFANFVTQVVFSFSNDMLGRATGGMTPS